ncbi:MAG: PTS sugar transporter subunit IIA [Gemmatimonadales bacterium]|nr:PTS sugar transporter subunit IIA [Gemmatimonadales bacterium]
MFWTAGTPVVTIVAMKLLDYTTESGFIPNIKCGDVAAAVSRLVEGLAADGQVIDSTALVDEIMRREEEGSTAIGGGLVIPHARSKNVQQVRVAVATLADPIPVPAEDDRPVDVVILLVGPDGDPRLMLRVLARLARLVKHSSFLDSLREAESAEDLRAVFSQLD